MDSWMIRCLISSSDRFVLAATVTELSATRAARKSFTDLLAHINWTTVSAEERTLIQNALHAAQSPRFVLPALEATH